MYCCLQTLMPPAASSSSKGSQLQAWLHSPLLPRLLQAAAAMLSCCAGAAEAVALKVRTFINSMLSTACEKAVHPLMHDHA
jgi:hypothetical protein